MTVVCVDSGFLIGLYQQSHPNHQKAQEHFVAYFEGGFNHLLIPWPTLYEAVRTQMVGKKEWIARLGTDWGRLRARGRLDFIEDQPYRTNALRDCLAEPSRPRGYRALSLTDRVIRSMMADANVRIDALITYNPADFLDVCNQYLKTLVS